MREEKTVTVRAHRNGTVTAAAPKRRRRKKRRLSPFARGLILLLIVLAGVGAGGWRLLRVGRITVTGDAGYTASQVVTASGLHAGMPLFAVSGRKAGQKICAALPMVASAQVCYRPFTDVTIAVTKDTLAYVASTKDGVAALDKQWKVVAVAKDASQYASLPLIKGVSFGTVQAGRPITGTPLTQLKEAQTILAEIRSAKLDKITDLDVSNSYQLTAGYDGRITIVLGTSSDIPYKIKFAAGLLTSKIGAAEKGTLDVSQSAQSNRASFIPS